MYKFGTLLFIKIRNWQTWLTIWANQVHQFRILMNHHEPKWFCYFSKEVKFRLHRTSDSLHQLDPLHLHPTYTPLHSLAKISVQLMVIIPWAEQASLIEFHSLPYNRRLQCLTIQLDRTVQLEWQMQLHLVTEPRGLPCWGPPCSQVLTLKPGGDNSQSVHQLGFTACNSP